MKILSTELTRAADAYTIKNEPIASIDLMERAAKAAAEALWALAQKGPYLIFCGMGNNGGDGLTIARILKQRGSEVQVALVKHSKKGSPNFETNLDRWKRIGGTVLTIEDTAAIPPENNETYLVDAILGSGLNRPLHGLLAEVVKVLNYWYAKSKIAIDIPTGLFSDDNWDNDFDAILWVNHSLTFQHPKQSMLKSETNLYAGKIHVLDIGLSEDFYRDVEVNDYWLEVSNLRQMYKFRTPFSHKGHYGHLYLWAGQSERAGAALLAAEAALRSGCGLLSAQVPGSSVTAFNQRLPEAMLLFDHSRQNLLDSDFSAYAVGPGLGTKTETAQRLKQLLQEKKAPLVLDADALNLLAQNPSWLNLLPAETILTPHPGEWYRICNALDTDSEDYANLRAFAQKYNCTVVLKDAVTCIASPDGKLIYSAFGTPALAKGGSGDVLTGIIGSLLAQNYSSLEASTLAVFLHGTAASHAEKKLSTESVLASDVIAHLHTAFLVLQKSH